MVPVDWNQRIHLLRTSDDFESERLPAVAAANGMFERISFPHLESLNLSNCSLKTIEANAFSGMLKLKKLEWRFLRWIIFQSNRLIWMRSFGSNNLVCWELGGFYGWFGGRFAWYFGRGELNRSSLMCGRLLGRRVSYGACYCWEHWFL